MNSPHAIFHVYNFILPYKRLYDFQIKNFVRWIAKNRDFLQKNSIFLKNERLRFHRNSFQTKNTILPKKYSVLSISNFQRGISIMRQIEISEIRNFVLKN